VPGVDPSLLKGAVNDLLGFKASQEQYDAAAQGARLTAEGAGIEAGAYRTAAGLAGESAKDEALMEAVRQVQIDTQVNQTIGGIKADVAGANFQQSGSAIDIMAASTRQGLLSQQISGYQSQQTQRGFLGEQAAAQGEAAAADVRQTAALALADQYDANSASAVAQEAAMTNALTQLLSGDENAQQFTSDLLSGNTTNLTADVLLYNPVGETNTLATSPEVKPPPLGSPIRIA
jgi:lipopolysaccharide export system protein LptC